jgi:hypothetical protein
MVPSGSLLPERDARMRATGPGGRVDVSGRSLSGISPRRHAMLLIACSRLMARLLIWLPTGYLDHVLA